MICGALVSASVILARLMSTRGGVAALFSQRPPGGAKQPTVSFSDFAVRPVRVIVPVVSPGQAVPPGEQLSTSSPSCCSR